MPLLTIKKEGKDFQTLETSGFDINEDMVRLTQFWYLWQGETKIDFGVKEGFLWVNNKRVGVDLSIASDIPDRDKIFTVVVAGSELEELKSFPVLTTVVIIGQARSEGLLFLKSMPNLKALSLENAVIDDPIPSLEIIGKMNNLRALNLARSGISVHQLHNISGLSNLSYLDVSQNHVTDSGLQHLRVLPKLKTLILGRTRITNKGLKYIKHLSGLRVLRLDCLGIDNSGLAFLSGIIRLHNLDLSCTDIDDDGLKIIAKMEKLRSLDLANTSVSNAGLRHLRSLTELRFLDLDQTYCSSKGKDKLTKYLPKCKIMGEKRSLM